MSKRLNSTRYRYSASQNYFDRRQKWERTWAEWAKRAKAGANPQDNSTPKKEAA